MDQSDWKDKYLNIIEEMEEGYAEVDLDGKLTSVNQALCKIWGYSREEMIGQTHELFTSPQQARENFEKYSSVLKTGNSIKSYVFEGIRKDGTKRLLDISASLMNDQHGNPTGFRTIFRDITEQWIAQEQLDAQRSRLGAILQSVRDGIITVDPDMNIIEYNDVAREICSLASDARLGHQLTDPRSECDSACLKLLKDTLEAKTGVQRFDHHCHRKNHSPKYLVMSSLPLLNAEEELLGAMLLIRDNTRLRDLERQLNDRRQYQEIIGKNAHMQEIYNLLDDLKDLDTTVLVTGENGTGKELIARALHFNGKRESKPFVTVNCSALAENLLESELFGHVKGAFTGAVRDSDGRFKTADGGTILLDEIGDISPRIQLKLLRVLQEKVFEAVGSSTPIRVDVRLIACTNRNLKQLVESGIFREDLYYRLKVIEIEVPPLRHRQDDIPLLAKHFIKRFNTSFNKSISAVDDSVMEVFAAYPWPGNVRELEHIVERAFVLCHVRSIGLDHLPKEIIEGVKKQARTSAKDSTDESSELKLILQQTGWNKAKTARLMGISRPTLYLMIKKHGLSAPTEKV
ncbi:MAG: sigma 54-interacting transcriptional regulator [Deltaproteobacteria bacterium]|nr:sigma 54-interacting transcriptional regulator [Deltaproteobacteria bacterium]